MSSAVKEIDGAPPRVWHWTHKHTKCSKSPKTQTLPFLFFSFLPSAEASTPSSSPPWVSNQWVDTGHTGNASHGRPYKAARKLTTSGFRAQVAAPSLLPPLLQSPSLYQQQHPVFIGSYFTQRKGPRCELHKGLLAV